MSNIIVLGAGMVGSAIAADLAKNHFVSVTDINKDSLAKANLKHSNISTQFLDVTNKEDLKKAIKGHDLAVCAVPGSFGFQTLSTIIESGMNVIDISFSPEDSLALDGLAKEKKVTAIVDCGVAPGMHNLILGYYNEKMNLSHFECLVGGLPKERKWPFCYKAPFSPIDVLEEYTRPARYVENGVMVVREALSDCEFVEFEGVGTLESFNSDGLRSIIFTLPHIPNMKEKTLRYPGHIEYIKVLKESGFFDKEEIEINGNRISPIDFTSKILFREWKLGDSEAEFTIMRVTLRGANSNGETEEVVYSLYDEYCNETQTSSMARTTGYTASAAANMVLDGLFSEKGVFPPELVGKYESCFKYIINYLKDRNIHYKKTSSFL